MAARGVGWARIGRGSGAVGNSDLAYRGRADPLFQWRLLAVDVEPPAESARLPGPMREFSDPIKEGRGHSAALRHVKHTTHARIWKRLVFSIT